MSKLVEKLKRMEPFHANAKQKQLKMNIKEPEIDLSTHEQMEQKFNELCQKQSHTLVNFDLKVPPPQSLDELKIKNTNHNKDNNHKHLRSNLKKKSTIIGNNNNNVNNKTLRQSVVIQCDDYDKQQLQSLTSSLQNISLKNKKKNNNNNNKNNIKSNRQSIMIKDSISPTTQSTQNLKSSQGLINNNSNSQSKLTPIKIINNNSNDKHKQQQYQSQISQSMIQLLPTPQKRLTQHLELRSSQGNIRFSKKKSTIIHNSDSKKNHHDDNDSDIEERISQSPEWLLIQQKLKNAIKNNNNNNNGNNSSQHQEEPFNPLVKLFGNNFIAMVLQALVVKKIDDLYGVKINTDSHIPISENLLKQFAISPSILSTLSTANEKKQYIADTMSARIALMIKEYDDKQNLREMKLKQEENIENRNEERKSIVSKDMFDWLKIGTNHDHLQRKLRMTIIEKLTDFENQEEISKLRRQKLEENNNNDNNNNQQQLTPRQKYEDKEKSKIHLKNLPYVSTKVLLLRMDEKDNKYLKEGMTKEQLDQYEEVNHVDYMNENKKHANIKSDNQDESNKNKNNHDKNNNGNNGSSDDDELPEWGEELEKEFLNNKRVARIIYSQDIQASSWSQQGYLPLVQEYNLTNKKKMEREQLISNYQNGAWLTEKELKFIADTSELLNKCIDKQYVQKIVNHISKEDISRLELSLAENIITNYENMQQLIRNQRLKFLEQRQMKTLQEREEVRKKQMIKEQREKEIKIQRRYVKMFKTIGDRLLSSKVQFVFDIFQQNFFCRLFFEKMRDILQRFRKRKQLLAYQTQDSIKKDKLNVQLANQKDFVQRLAKAENSRKQCSIQHELHPPSKIAYFPPSDEVVEKKREELINFMVDRFQLTTRSKQEVRIQSNFSKYYSGGPQKQDQDDDNPTIGQKQETLKVQLTKKQFAGIVRVQRLFRQFRMRKIIKNMKEQEFSIKSTIYRDKLKSYMSGRNFLKAAQKKTGSDLGIKKTQQLIQDAFKQDDKSDFSQSLYSSDGEDNNKNNENKDQLDKLQVKNNNTLNKLNKNSQLKQKFIQLTNGNQGQQQDLNVKEQSNHFYNISSMYGGETISTDRHFNINSKTIDSDYPIKYNNNKDTSHINHNNNNNNNNSSYKFLSNERYDTRSNVDESENNISNDSPKTKASLEHYKKNQQLKNNQSATIEKNRISFTKCETQEDNENDHSQYQKHKQYDESGYKTNTNNNYYQSKNNLDNISFLTPKSLRYTPTLLLKQQKLLTAAKLNKFLMIKNSGYIINESDVNIRDKEGHTPLYYAIFNQNIVFIRWLLSKGANPNTPCGNNNDTPVHIAFKSNNMEIIHDILCVKPNFNLVNNEGMTALAYASEEIMKKFNLKNAIVYKKELYGEQNEEIETKNNNGLFINKKLPFKGISKLKINSFYPIQTPTIQIQNYTSM